MSLSEVYHNLHERFGTPFEDIVIFCFIGIMLLAFFMVQSF